MYERSKMKRIVSEFFSPLEFVEHDCLSAKFMLMKVS